MQLPVARADEHRLPVGRQAGDAAARCVALPETATIGGEAFGDAAHVDAEDRLTVRRHEHIGEAAGDRQRLVGAAIQRTQVNARRRTLPVERLILDNQQRVAARHWQHPVRAGDGRHAGQSFASSSVEQLRFAGVIDHEELSGGGHDLSLVQQPAVAFPEAFAGRRVEAAHGRIHHCAASVNVVLDAEPGDEQHPAVGCHGARKQAAGIYQICGARAGGRVVEVPAQPSLRVERVQLAGAAEVGVLAGRVLEHGRAANRDRERTEQPGRRRGNAALPAVIEAEAILRVADANLHRSSVDGFQRAVEGRPEILPAKVARAMLLNLAAGAECEQRVAHRRGRHENSRAVGRKGDVENRRAKLACDQMFEWRRRAATSHDRRRGFRFRLRLRGRGRFQTRQPGHGCGRSVGVVTADVESVEAALKRRPEVMNEEAAGSWLRFRRDAPQVGGEFGQRPVRGGLAEQHDVGVVAQPRSIFVVAAFRIVEDEVRGPPRFRIGLAHRPQRHAADERLSVAQAFEQLHILRQRLPSQRQRRDFVGLKDRDPRRAT